MQIVFKTRHFKITRRVKIYLQKKLAKFEHWLPEATFIEITLEDIYGPKGGKDKKIHLSIDIPGERFIHLEEKTSDIYASIDIVIKKFNRQIKKIKGKTIASRSRIRKVLGSVGGVIGWVPTKLAARFRPKRPVSTRDQSRLGNRAQTDQAEAEKEETGVVKRKKFDLSSSITEEQAIEEMNALGHDFFYFKNKATDKFTVIYRRKRGGYGTIEPKE